MFEYWTEDDFASSFRKMLTIEQFRSEEMQKLYQQYLVAGPASYVKDLFESIGIANAKDKAARFYAVMYFYYSLYDGAADKEKVKDRICISYKKFGTRFGLIIHWRRQQSLISSFQRQVYR